MRERRGGGIKYEGKTISLSSPASSRLFLALVTTLLEPVLYGATEVGYEYKLDATPRGFTLTFGGLSDRTIVERIISETISSE